MALERCGVIHSTRVDNLTYKLLKQQEETLEIEYIESVMPPQKMSDFPHEDWVSSVSCHVQGCVLEYTCKTFIDILFQALPDCII